MTSPTIEVVISPSGETRIETTGFAGSACQGATRLLESALGAKAGERLTAEYYHQPQSELQHRRREGGS